MANNTNCKNIEDCNSCNYCNSCYSCEDEDPAKAYDDLVHQGYNQALDQWEQAILELMK